MLTRIFAMIGTGCMMVSSLPAQQAATPPLVVKIARNTLVRCALMQPLDPAIAKPGDDVPLRLTRSLTADGVVVLPVGTIVHGKVAKVTPSGRRCTKGAVKLKVKEIPLPDGSAVKVEVWNTYREPNARVASDTNKHHSKGEIAGYVVLDVVLVPLIPPALAVGLVQQVVTAPSRRGSCTPWRDFPLPANATVAVRIRENHTMRY